MPYDSPGLGLSRKRQSNGYALPEVDAASAADAAARAVSSPTPQTSGLGLAKPGAIPSTSLPPQAETPPVSPLPAAAPAAPVAAPAAAAQPEKPLIDFHTNPLGAIGLVLSSVAAGMRGDPSPVAALQKQHLEQQAQAYQTADMGLNAIEKYTKILAATDPKDQPAVVDHAVQMFGPLFGPGFGATLKGVVNGQIKDGESKLQAARSLGIINPQTIGAVTDDNGNVNIGMLDKLLEVGLDIFKSKASRQTPEEIAANAKATAEGTKQGGKSPAELAADAAATAGATRKTPQEIQAEAAATARGTKEGNPDKSTAQIEAEAAARARGEAAGSGSKAKPNEAQTRDAKLYSELPPERKNVVDYYDSLTSWVNKPGRTLEALTGSMALTGSEYQRAKNSAKKIVASYLYSTSGQQAPPAEIETQLGLVMPANQDGKATLADKKARLLGMVETIRHGAGPALDNGGDGADDPLGLR